MNEYDAIRQRFRPQKVRYLLIAESPPPVATVSSSRHFYRTDQVRKDDRLFVNTIKALYPETEKLTEGELEQAKEYWLGRFQQDGWYMIEALKESQPHEVTKRQRQERIREELTSLIRRVSVLADKHTKLILIKSNVFEIAAAPLKGAGYNILNTELVDYPGHFNQRAYREKLRRLVRL